MEKDNNFKSSRRSQGGKSNDQKPYSRPARSGNRPFRKEGDKPFHKDGEKPFRKEGDKPFRKEGERPFRKEGDKPATKSPRTEPVPSAIPCPR